MKSFNLLAVDDNAKIIESIKLVLGGEYPFFSASNGEDALEIIAHKKIDLIFLDIQLPGISGLEVLKRVKDSGENIAVVMVTGANTVKMAVEAMKLGAVDYLTKPFDPEELLIVAQKAVENCQLSREVMSLRSQISPTSYQNIIGQSRAIRDVCATIDKIASTDVSVMIQGETGTGKELAARAIHFGSTRKAKPFLALNCAAIPENLLETELFGYERGAFTGAERQKPGKFELAGEGTLFLDEISSLRLDMQGKILRAVESQEIERVGGVKAIRVSPRIVSATNTDLKKMIREGKFREDLYYRLFVMPIMMPPLRERKEDMPLLVSHFVEINNKKFNKRVKGVSKKALEYLTDYSWPGNIRELENVIERMMVLSETDILETRDLPFDLFLKIKERMVSLLGESLILKEARDFFEKEFITGVLQKTRWNQSEAARALGIHRNTLLLKKDQLGISEEAVS